MSTVKISQLPIISAIDANTANTLFAGVDVPTGSTGKMTAQVLARGLYSNEILNVGGNPVLYPNVAAQFASTSNTYLQINLQNFNSNGSSDIVASASDSDNANNYVDMGINGKTFNDPIYTSMKPYDAYVYSHGPAHTSYQGNLVIGTASSDANIVFIAGGTLAGNIVGRISKDTFDFLKDTRVTGDIAATGSVTGTNITVMQGVDAGQNAAITIIQNTDLTQNASITAAFLKANTVQANLDGANANITIIQNTNLTQNASTQAAFDKANNALANTSGTFGGNLNLTGNLTAQGIQSTTGAISTGNLIVTGTANVSGTLNVVGAVSMNAKLILANSNFSATESAVTITASPTVATPSNDGYMIHISGKNGIPSRIVSDAYGTGAYSVYASRSARGTVTSPTAVQAGDIMGRISSNGYGTTKFQQFGTGRIDFVATENYTDANTGSQIKFWNCPIGSNTLTNIATFNGDSVTFTGVVNPAKGFIYTPTTYPGAQTAVVIDFSNNSVIRANTSAGLSVSFSNYTYGKVVELWVTNTSGFGQTFTHGCSALASTTNSTTYSIPSTASILARYMCFDGDAANVYVSITHA